MSLSVDDRGYRIPECEKFYNNFKGKREITSPIIESITNNVPNMLRELTEFKTKILQEVVTKEELDALKNIIKGVQECAHKINDSGFVKNKNTWVDISFRCQLDVETIDELQKGNQGLYGMTTSQNILMLIPYNHGSEAAMLNTPEIQGAILSFYLPESEESVKKPADTETEESVKRAMLTVYTPKIKKEVKEAMLNEYKKIMEEINDLENIGIHKSVILRLKVNAKIFEDEAKAKEEKNIFKAIADCCDKCLQKKEVAKVEKVQRKKEESEDAESQGYKSSGVGEAVVDHEKELSPEESNLTEHSTAKIIEMILVEDAFLMDNLHVILADEIRSLEEKKEIQFYRDFVENYKKEDRKEVIEKIKKGELTEDQIKFILRNNM